MVLFLISELMLAPLTTPQQIIPLMTYYRRFPCFLFAVLKHIFVSMMMTESIFSIQWHFLSVQIPKVFPSVILLITSVSGCDASQPRMWNSFQRVGTFCLIAMFVLSFQNDGEFNNLLKFYLILTRIYIIF